MTNRFLVTTALALCLALPGTAGAASPPVAAPPGQPNFVPPTNRDSVPPARQGMPPTDRGDIPPVQTQPGAPPLPNSAAPAMPAITHPPRPDTPTPGSPFDQTTQQDALAKARQGFEASLRSSGTEQQRLTRQARADALASLRNLEQALQPGATAPGQHDAYHEQQLRQWMAKARQSLEAGDDTRRMMQYLSEVEDALGEMQAADARNAAARANRSSAAKDPATGSRQNAAPQQQGTTPGRDLIGKPLYGPGGKVGEISKVATSKSGALDYIVLDVGQYLGIGERQVRLGSDQLMIHTDRVVVPGLTHDEVERLPRYIGR